GVLWMSRVMVVDDDPTSVALCVFALELEGHQAVGFIHPSEAMAQAKREPFDAVVASLGMREMSGWEVLGQLKTDPAAHNPPVLFIARDGFALLRLLTLITNDDVYGMAKPFDIAEFIDEVQRLVDIHERQRAA
ncbi:MAG: response regulator, partial [Dehalococcoidia bacterium]|nr:response regulator [Dehalococcoidia bacterium]